MVIIASGCESKKAETTAEPSFTLMPTDTFRFNHFVDCNMASAWVGDTFRIFPGKYGEDPVWGHALDLKYAEGVSPDEVFSTPTSQYKAPKMPLNAPTGEPGLHGAVWFESVYQDSNDPSGKTLYALYHNENYPETLPFNPKTGEGYIDKNWPLGLTDRITPAAVPRIGIMKSRDGGKSWENRGIILEDLQDRMILKPFNTSKTFAGGVGDPSAVASGDYLYIFYGEYGYPGKFDEKKYDPQKEWAGQCISVARIALKDLDAPYGKVSRWNGTDFSASWNGIGQPISALQISKDQGGGPASSPKGGFHWGPSVSWNTYLNAWVMLMGHVQGQSWVGDKVYISFNTELNLANATNKWTKPRLLVHKPGRTLWYPSLQPLNDKQQIQERYTSMKLGKVARLFYKFADEGRYLSEYTIQFDLTITK
ncbi:hypothetical protein EZE20_13515 [Arundinibacter roseus]|uniref:Exo-alpha-sialidase n=2 Tax=Arundinibacter roseus TaxID=2070510 RepID=A0A4R4KD09_9BACT|nr:hypothetical protein EZE20_13515 [Arundinibacter roseus]